MTLKIERDSDVDRTTVRLIGRIQADHLDELRAQMAGDGPRIVLDLEEVTLVDLQVVRFLGTCEKEGAELLHCRPYIREWISREQRGDQP